MSTVKESGSGGKITVEFQDNVAIIRMCRGTNRLNLTFIRQFTEALATVKRNKNISLLITTGEDRYYSIGIDVDWLKGQSNLDTVTAFRSEWKQLTVDLLTFPIPTVAAMNGHAFAGGAILALSHDYKVMRTDRGWFCLNEVHLGLYFDSFLVELLRLKLPTGTVFNEIVALGARFTAQEAKERGIVDAIAPQDGLIDVAKEVAKGALWNGPINRKNLGFMKGDIYKTVLEKKDKMEVLRSSIVDAKL